MFGLCCASKVENASSVKVTKPNLFSIKNSPVEIVGLK